MSQTICKSLNTVKLEDGKWHVKCVSCSSNVYPHTYRPYVGSGHDSREYLDGELIYEYYGGMLRGSTRYATFVDEMYYGVQSCPAWDSFMRMSKLRDKAFHRALQHLNDPADSSEKKRWCAVEARVNRWHEDTFTALGRAYRAWKPCPDTFRVRIPEGYITRVGRHTFHYVPDYQGAITRAKVFTAAAAARFCADFKSHNPTREKVAA